ncbi:MAG: MCP four helix bundle domain-containing protein, partial [Rugosibacter sp.]|nr:MCP four helix bundle domain-containing protein [Rugosibacter sp.]
MKIGNLKIGTRLGISFTITLALLVVIMALGISRMTLIYAHLEDITKINNVQSQLAVTLRETIAARAIASRNLALMTKEDDMRAEMLHIDEQTTIYTEAEEKLNEMFASLPGTTEEEKAIMVKLRINDAVATPIMDRVIELGLNNQPEEAITVLINDLRPAQKELMETISTMITLQTKLNEQVVADAEQAYVRARRLIFALTGFAIVFGAGVALFITRSVTRPLSRAVKVAETVASGDLTAHIEIDSQDETGQLLLALKNMNASLVGIVSEVRAGTDTIATTSSQIAAGNQELSTRTEGQASSLEETAA